MGLLHNEGLIIKKAEFTYFFLDKSSIVGSRATFSPEESRHLVTVCRAAVGDLVSATDGDGAVYQIEIDDVSKAAVAGRITDTTRHDRPDAGCQLAVPIASQQKVDWIVEKCTELGVAAIHLFTSDKSVAKRITQTRIKRLHRLAVSAIKQSMRSFLPRFHTYDDLKSLVGAFGDFDLVVYGDLGDHSRGLRSAIESSDAGSVLIVVGPEPGFTAEERFLLEDAGAVPVTYGNHRLRMETAAVVLPALVMELLRAR